MPLPFSLHLARFEVETYNHTPAAMNDGKEVVELLLPGAGDRKVVYLMAPHIGLRRPEIKQLQWGDVSFNADIPVVRARASTTENRKPALIPVHEDLVHQLREMKQKKTSADQLVFKRTENATVQK